MTASCCHLGPLYTPPRKHQSWSDTVAILTTLLTHVVWMAGIFQPSSDFSVPCGGLLNLTGLVPFLVFRILERMDRGWNLIRPPQSRWSLVAMSLARIALCPPHNLYGFHLKRYRATRFYTGSILANVEVCGSSRVGSSVSISTCYLRPNGGCGIGKKLQAMLTFRFSWCCWIKLASFRIFRLELHQPCMVQFQRSFRLLWYVLSR